MSENTPSINALSTPNDDLCLIDLDILLHSTGGKTTPKELHLSLHQLKQSLVEKHYNLLHHGQTPLETIEGLEFPSLPFERGDWLDVDILRPRWLTVRKLDYVRTEQKTFDLYVIDFSFFAERLNFLLTPLAEELEITIDAVIDIVVDYIVRHIYDIPGVRNVEIEEYLSRTLNKTYPSPLSRLLDELNQFIASNVRDQKPYYLHFVDTTRSTLNILIDKESKK